MLSLSSLVVLSILVFHAGANVNFQSNDDLGTVVLTNVIYRHGDRTPIEPYPTDPYGNLSFWPTGWGQLTNIGKEQHYQLGRWFRERYADLLPQKYAKEDILVRSTDVDRALMSAASNLAGLYPPMGPQVWDSNVTWQPIPIHTLPETMDNILAAKKKCPKYDTELKNVKQSEDIQQLNRHYFELMAYTSAQCGREITELQGIEFIYNTLFIENIYNFTLPEWTGSVFPKKMVKPAARSFTIAAYNLILQRLKSGPLLGEIVGHMKRKANGTLSPDRKMFMYSGHDTTIANMLMTLGNFKPHNPPYTATILFELRKNLAQEYIVTVWYRNGTSPQPMLLTIPGCIPACPLDFFINLTEHLVPEDWEKECHEKVIYEGFCGNMGLTEFLGMIIVALVVLIILLLTCKQCRKHQDPYTYRRLPFTTDLA